MTTLGRGICSRRAKQEEEEDTSCRSPVASADICCPAGCIPPVLILAFVSGEAQTAHHALLPQDNPQNPPPPNAQTHNNRQDMHCLRDPWSLLPHLCGFNASPCLRPDPGKKNDMCYIFITASLRTRGWAGLPEFEKCQQIKWK